MSNDLENHLRYPVIVIIIPFVTLVMSPHARPLDTYCLHGIDCIIDEADGSVHASADVVSFLRINWLRYPPRPASDAVQTSQRADQ